ncbi:DNA-binding protein D-ETS-4 isoform X1 [Onthophagus taurus]|uniref:DNA-binding protein D-ETS-4 isoform X1 n=1 Tax=Onthophagus taurus TaxID=166361 RepID=UPI0039BDDAD2
MVLLTGNTIAMDDSMPQIVPSAGFTPPCDYNSFVDFDLSLLPGGDTAFSASTLLYSPPAELEKPKIFTTFYPNPPDEDKDINLGPDFQKLLPESPNCGGVYLEVPSSKNYHANSPIGALSPYSPQLLSPNYTQDVYSTSPDVSLYNSPRDDFRYMKEDYSSLQIKQESASPTPDVFELLQNSLGETKAIKQESTVDFSILHNYNAVESQIVPQSTPQDHQLLRQVLRDTSFQKKYNIKPLDFEFMSNHIKMEEPDDNTQELMEPVLNLAMKQVKEDVVKTCAELNISSDILKWTPGNVLSWLEFACREHNLPRVNPDQWNIDGCGLVNMTEEEFNKRTLQGGGTLYGKLELWKTTCMEEPMQWQQHTPSSTASSGDISDEDDEDSSSQTIEKPTTSRTSGGSHIHLWQFLKELLASPQVHGSCIRWIDRGEGIFKIEDSVKVAKLWGKRKNRPAMNYDKLSRSIRQYYKKGIMKKTQRSQRLVYQFCQPYCL